MSLADKPIYPIFGKTLAQIDPETGAVTVIGGTGMTLLQHYAGLAMQSLIAKGTGQDTIGGRNGVPIIAKYSVEYAQALIAELEKVQK